MTRALWKVLSIPAIVAAIFIAVVVVGVIAVVNHEPDPNISSGEARTHSYEVDTIVVGKCKYVVVHSRSYNRSISVDIEHAGDCDAEHHRRGKGNPTMVGDG